MIYPETRKCSSCKMDRVPDTKIVRKNGKRWLILTCRICKMKDIEKAGPPMKVFFEGRFIDEPEFSEDSE